MGLSLKAVFRSFQRQVMRWNFFWVTVAAVLSSTAPTRAIIIGIDQFSIVRDGAPFFTDNFNDGMPPPSAPNFASGLAASYAVQGTIPGNAESGGFLLLDSANGELGINAAGIPRLTISAALLTSGSTRLGVGNTFLETGLFNLTIPSGPLYSSYGITLRDPNQAVVLNVEFNQTTGIPDIALRLQNFAADTITTLGTRPLLPPVGADQILLGLDRVSTANDDVFGDFLYLKGGSLVGSGSFLTPALIFQNGEDFVRGVFDVSQAPVPESGSAWFFVPGIMLLLAIRRSRNTLGFQAAQK